jgi:hypothetical protein
MKIYLMTDYIKRLVIFMTFRTHTERSPPHNSMCYTPSSEKFRTYFEKLFKFRLISYHASVRTCIQELLEAPSDYHMSTVSALNLWMNQMHVCNARMIWCWISANIQQNQNILYWSQPKPNMNNVISQLSSPQMPRILMQLEHFQIKFTILWLTLGIKLQLQSYSSMRLHCSILISLEHGIYPERVKSASLRPISLLISFSKIFESDVQ